MRHFQNSVLDFKATVSDRYESCALETAWASEAIFFLRVEEIAGSFTFHAVPQISVDGVDWIEEGTAFPPITQAGQYALRLKHFGGWLRVVGHVTGDGSATITTNLVLKE